MLYVFGTLGTIFYLKRKNKDHDITRFTIVYGIVLAVGLFIIITLAMMHLI